MAPGMAIYECAPATQETKFPSVILDYKSPSKPSVEIEKVIDKLSKQFTNPSLVVHDRRLELCRTPIPRPTPTQVLLRIRCTGICGSDIHLWHRGAIGPLKVTSPCILGHEAAGEVLAVGSLVQNLQPGDRVAVEPGVPCETCFLCRAGKYNLCEGVKFAGVAGCDGSIRRFMVHEGRYCHKIPDSMTFRTAALLEPLAVVMHAIASSSGQIALGRPVHVCGAGPIGLIALKAARASGAWPLSVSDVDERRLEFARKFVPGCKTWLITETTPLVNAEGVRQLFGLIGDRDVEMGMPETHEHLAPNVVLECTGVESSVATAAYICRRGGTVVVVGVGKSVMNNLPFMHLSLAEINLRFINRYRDMWPAAIQLLGDGKVMDLNDLVTRDFELNQAVEAMEACADRALGEIKIHIVDNALPSCLSEP